MYPKKKIICTCNHCNKSTAAAILPVCHNGSTVQQTHTVQTPQVAMRDTGFAGLVDIFHGEAAGADGFGV